MAHLRFTRDRRGYETTALLHAGGRRRSKGQRLLYFFRTPPGVRVGRAPIDEDAIRLLEEHNPDVQFDWTRILKDPAPAEPARREQRPPREGRDRRREERPRSRPPEPVAAVPAPSAPAAPEFVEYPEEIDAEDTGIVIADNGVGDGEAAVIEEAPPPLSYAEEAAAQLESIEPEAAGEAEEPDSAGTAGSPDNSDEGVDTFVLPALSLADEGSASYKRLGAEGLGRLRARYAEVMARIAEQPVDDDAKEQLKAKAERLNPDGWVTADEVAAALEQYETVFEELRALVGREPRRRRRRRR